MNKSINARLRAWYRLSKSMGILSTQDELRQQLKNKEGKPVSQGFIAAMMTGNSPIPDHMIDQIVRAYPFTDAEYFLSGSKPIVDLSSLARYVISKEGIDIREFLIKTEVSNSFISQMTLSTSDPGMMRSVFDEINSYGYRIDLEAIEKSSRNVGAIQEEFKGADEWTERFIDLIDFLIKSGRAESRKEVCEKIGITSSHLSNMTHPGMRAKASISMLKGLAAAFPDVNLDYVVCGVGNRLKDSSEIINDIIDLKKGQLIIREMIARMNQNFSFA